MSNFFDDNSSELEMLEEAQELENYEEEEYSEEESEQAYLSDQEEIDELVDEVSSKKPSYSLNKQEKSVVSEAMLRLEQARLYEMLLKHNFFDGVRINLVAKQNVEQELKKFILDRLEILLGIKQDSVQSVSSEVTFDLPFNDVEVEFLKALAYKGTNGASESSNAAQAQATVQPIQNLPKMKQQEGLRPLAQARPKQVIQPVRQAPTKQIARPQQPVRKTQPVQQRQVAPKQVKSTPKKNRTLEEIAREDIAKMKNRKPAHEMTVKELMAANKKIEGGGSRARPANALPMPSAEQQITSIIASKSSSSKGTGDFNSILSNALGAIPLETIADDY